MRIGQRLERGESLFQIAIASRGRQIVVLAHRRVRPPLSFNITDVST
jgi:hypothetical protein